MLQYWWHSGEKLHNHLSDILWLGFLCWQGVLDSIATQVPNSMILVVSRHTWVLCYILIFHFGRPSQKASTTSSILYSSIMQCLHCCILRLAVSQENDAQGHFKQTRRAGRQSTGCALQGSKYNLSLSQMVWNFKIAFANVVPFGPSKKSWGDWKRDTRPLVW